MKMRTLPYGSEALPRLWAVVVLEHIVHRHAKLVLRAVDVVEFGRIAGVRFLDRHRLIFFDEYFLGFIEADGFLEVRSEAGPQAGVAELLVGEILQPHVLRQVERLFIVRGDGAVIEALGEISEQIADPHARGAGVAGRRRSTRAPPPSVDNSPR